MFCFHSLIHFSPILTPPSALIASTKATPQPTVQVFSSSVLGGRMPRRGMCPDKQLCTVLLLFPPIGQQSALSSSWEFIKSTMSQLISPESTEKFSFLQVQGKVIILGSRNIAEAPRWQPVLSSQAPTGRKTRHNCVWQVRD